MDEAKSKNFGPRMVTGVRGALTTGPSRKWLVFKEAYSDRLNNTIRSKKVGDGALAAATGFHPVKQAFFVTDTSAGGGSVVSDTVNFDGKIKHRVANAPVATPVWASGNSIDITHTWLDTNEIDGATTGYSGRPEVLSFTTATGFSPTYIAWYQGGNAEILGEFIFYTEPLADADRVKVQEYLMYKWFGDLNGKYADYSGATVTGAGTVKSPTLRNLPNFAAGFTGTVAGGSQLSFTVDSSINASAATDAIALGQAFTLDDGATLTVVLGSRPAPGNYTLLTAPSISGSAILQEAGDVRNRKLTLHVDSRSIWLEVKAPGFVMAVR